MRVKAADDLMLKGGLGPPDPLNKAFPEAAPIIMTTNEAQKGVASIFSEREGGGGR